MTNHWFGRICLLLLVVLSPVTVATLINNDAADAASIQALTYGLACVALVGIEQGRRGSTARASGLILTPRSSRLFLLGTLWAVIALGVVLVAAILLGGRLSILLEPSFSFSGISTIVLFAIGEEVVFRGTLLESLNERYGPGAAILVTSVLFAFAHAANPGASMMSTWNVGLAGIALGTAVVRTSSLWMAIGFHVVWNVLLSSVFGVVSGIDLGIGYTALDTTFVPPEVRPWITGTFGVEEGYTTTILLVISIIIIARKAPYDPYVQAARFRRAFSS